MSRPILALLLLTIAALLVPAIRHVREGAARLPPPVRLSLSAPPGTTLGAGDEPLDAAISFDQREVVFVATQVLRTTAEQVPAGVTRLWRRRLDSEEATPLAGTEGARLPAWKQTGRVLSFFADGELKLLNLHTGDVTVVTDAPMPAGATWLRDGSLLFVPRDGPVRRLLNGRITDATQRAAGETSHAFPETVAGGTDFTYVAVRDDGARGVRVRSGGSVTDLGTTAAHAVLAVADWLLFVEDGALLADHRNEDGARASRSVALAADVGTTRTGRGLFAASADVLLHAGRVERPSRLTWLDQRGSEIGVAADVGDYRQVRVSPDGRYLAVTARDALLGSLDVLTIPVDGASPSLRLTESIGADTDPVWSPDNQRLLFRSLSGGRPEVFVTRSDIRPIVDGMTDLASAWSLTSEAEIPTDWRGTEMLLLRRGKTGFDLVRMRERDGSSVTGPRPVADSGFNETDGRWSPDGKWIAYVSDEPGRPDIYVVGRIPPFEAGVDGSSGTTPQRVSYGGGTHPRWTRDSRAVLFLRGSTIMRADVVSETRLGPPRPLFEVPGVRDFDVSRRNDRIVAVLPARGDPVSSVSVTLNWRSLAEARRQQSQPRTPPKF